MDTGSRGELIAANMSVEEIRDYLNVDTLSYLSIDRLVAATGAVGAGFCDACLTGSYPVPVPVPVTLGRSVLAIDEPRDPVGVLPGMGVLTEAEASMPATDAAQRGS